MILSAREIFRGSNESAYMFSLGSKIDRLDFTPTYHLRDVQWLAVAKLSDLLPNPDFNLTLSGKSQFGFNSTTTSDLVLNSTFHGTYSPYYNLTTIDAELDLANIWMITPQIALTGGMVHVYAEHQNGNWTVDPIAYNANGQMQLTGNVTSANVILADITGMFDPQGGDSYFILSATLGPLDGKFDLIMPKRNDTLPSAKDIELAQATFDMCVATKRVKRKVPTDTTFQRDPTPSIVVRPSDDGRGLAVEVPPERPRPPPRIPSRPRPDHEAAFGNVVIEDEDESTDPDWVPGAEPETDDDTEVPFGRHLYTHDYYNDGYYRRTTRRRMQVHPATGGNVKTWNYHVFAQAEDDFIDDQVELVVRVLEERGSSGGGRDTGGFATFNLPGEEDDAGGRSSIPLIPDR